MKPSRVTEILSHLLETRWPVFLWGPPGSGKSSVVRQIAEQKSVDLIDIRASLLDPTDLRGIPAVEKGRAVWAPPSFLPHDKDSSGVLFFDELNAAPPLVQASLYQLTLDRRVGEYELPLGWRIIAAGNRAEDASITFRMPAALANRFVHLDFEVDFDDWKRWALSAEVHAGVIGFISTRRELLMDMSNTDRGFPTPRSWEMLSDAVKEIGTNDDTLDVLSGIVGEGAAIEFLGYCKSALSEEAITKVLESPESASLPEDIGDRYALISYIATRAKEAKILVAAGKVIHRLPPEFGVLLVRDLLGVNPEFALNTDYQDFVSKHGEMLA